MISPRLAKFGVALVIVVWSVLAFKQALSFTGMHHFAEWQLCMLAALLGAFDVVAIKLSWAWGQRNRQ